ncbi:MULTISPECIES: hypothetical protein [Photorhabdus]|uniref:Uncharacterized protein n=2 Tax=Photorhabdus asymbiotica TaxID=291112 RepID=B6VL53_PHOAA|nr:hypothetical protein [Photorhabdus asymbiotica]RKS57129.1 hypothetical protein BDD30_3770 [Photorhabdus asymbiotica]CAQ84516.1 conserved hypothetical protein [Photorhabdus asymbiotica]CAR66883.1 Conserved Hypothetical Protein [Photorhabdus asymbiotica subsp. asymbiotica ATCC 43949]
MSNIALTDIQFIDLMNEMRQHAKRMLNDAKIEPFVPSTSELQAYANMLAEQYENVNITENEKIDGIINELKDSVKSGANSISQVSKTSVIDSTQKYQNAIISDPDNADQDWIDNMNKSRQRTKDENNRQIDTSYDKAIQYGLQFPNARAAIQSFMEKTGTFFSNLFGRLSSFILDAARQLTEWLNRAWETIKSFFERINSWISNAF